MNPTKVAALVAILRGATVEDREAAIAVVQFGVRPQGVEELVQRAPAALRSQPASEDRSRIARDAAVELVELLDAAGLSAVGVEMVRRIDTLGRVDPAGASRVAEAIYATFASARRESPVSLSDTLAPTEPVPSSPPGCDP